MKICGQHASLTIDWKLELATFYLLSLLSCGEIECGKKCGKDSLGDKVNPLLRGGGMLS